MQPFPIHARLSSFVAQTRKHTYVYQFPFTRVSLHSRNYGLKKTSSTTCTYTWTSNTKEHTQIKRNHRCVCVGALSLCEFFFIFFDYALELIQNIRTHIHGHATRPEKLSSIFHTHTHYTTLLIKVNVWETRRSISRATRSIQGGCGATADHPERPGHHQNTTTTTTSSFVFVVVVWREKARRKKIYIFDTVATSN